jgi:hypothetical protein
MPGVWLHRQPCAQMQEAQDRNVSSILIFGADRAALSGRTTLSLMNPDQNT